MTAPKLDRRRVMRLMLMAGIFVDVPRVFASAECRLGILEDIDGQFIAQLAREFLATEPEEAPLRDLTKLIMRDDDEQRIIGALRRLIEADYKSNQIVNLSGWFVSQTEARVFAVLSRCA